MTLGISGWKLHSSTFVSILQLSKRVLRGATQRARYTEALKSRPLTASSKLFNQALHLRKGKSLLSVVISEGLCGLKVNRHIYFTNFPNCLNIFITHITLWGKGIFRRPLKLCICREDFST
jgi:hypothetical protein